MYISKNRFDFALGVFVCYNHHMIKNIFFKLSIALFFLLWTPVMFICLVTSRSAYWSLWFGAVVILWIGRRFGIDYKLHGTPLNGVIVASKHMSIMDTAILGLAYKRVFFIIKRELMWIPIYGWTFWRMGFIPVNRKRGATDMRDLAMRAAKKIREGRTMIIFPEGTRVKPGAGISLRRGLLFIAAEANIPIQPVGLDTGLYWPKRGRMHPGTANAYFMPMLPADASLDEVAKAIAAHSA